MKDSILNLEISLSNINNIDKDNFNFKESFEKFIYYIILNNKSKNTLRVNEAILLDEIFSLIRLCKSNSICLEEKYVTFLKSLISDNIEINPIDVTIFVKYIKLINEL